MTLPAVSNLPSVRNSSVTFLIELSIANTFTGSFIFSVGPATLGNVAKIINGCLTGIVFSLDPNAPS